VRAGHRCAAWGAMFLVVAGFSSARAGAAPKLPKAHELEEVAAAVSKGAFSDAIDRLEHWSDLGLVNPDLSFDRGVAYLGRAESSAARPGDLGQAAAAFEEAAELDPDDRVAADMAGRVRELILERRAKREDAGIVARPRLTRALIAVVGENVWAGLAILGSIVATLGLLARLFFGSHRVRLGGSIATLAGVCLLVLGGTMAAAGRGLRARFSPAVVIVEEARLVDAGGRPLSSARGPSALGEAGDRVPEGAVVHVAESRGGLVLVEWGDVEAWLNAEQLRRLAVR
jgi:tetratricopeptide (TPR) repeat protein